MRTNKRLFLVALSLALAAGITFAGGGRQGAEGGKGEEEQITVGLALSAINTNSIFIDMRRAIEAKCQREGWRLITADLLEGAPKMITFLETCLATNAKVVIYQNIAEDSYSDLLQQLKDRGVILGSYDNPTRIAHYTSQASNEQLGLTIGREAGKWARANPGSKKAALCSYTLLDFLLIRGEAIKKGFLEECPEGKIVFEMDAGYVQQGVSAGEAIIQAHPDIQVVMGINDSGPVGAMEAFKAAGWNSQNHKSVGLFGCDASEDGMRALRENDMFKCTIYLDVVNQVVALFDRCVALYKTGVYDDSKANVFFPMTPVYLENAGIVK
ncbi:MAG: substrate-binding domain-containing protein [Treponema sp.]|nr:substrate-binding domain-containing protein [Treponema sp.]